MKPTIIPTVIILAPRPLADAWRKTIISDIERDKPLLAPEEVLDADEISDVSGSIEGDGTGQLFIVVASGTLPSSISLTRQVCRGLAIAVAENPEAPDEVNASHYEAARHLVDFWVTTDMKLRDGTSLYGAVNRFLERLPNPPDCGARRVARAQLGRA